MDKAQIRELVRDVHLGDLIRVEFQIGVFKKRTVDHTGYISELSPYSVDLTCSDPIENPPSTIFDSKRIMYDKMIGYSKLSQDKPASSK